MASDHFYCPHCNEKLLKSQQAQMMSEIMGDPMANFIATGPMADSVPCPRCRGPIDTQKMLAGYYDRTMPWYLGVVIAVVGIGAAYGINSVLEWGWFWSGIAAYVLVIVFFLMVDKLRRRNV